MNWSNVKKTIETFLEQKRGFGLSRRHITISTSGIVPGIKRMLDDGIKVMLAISLHAPNQELRQQLIPYAQIYKLEELLDVVKTYQAKTGNRIFWEYIMIDKVTDKPELAHQLAKLLR